MSPGDNKDNDNDNDNDNRGDDSGADSSESFKNLIGETRPLKRGKPIVRPLRQPPNPPATSSAASSKRDPLQSHTAASRSIRFRQPDSHESRLRAVDGVSNAQLLDLQRGTPAPEEKIDLHGVRSDAVPRILANRIDSAVMRGLRALLVIHGKGSSSIGGESVLRDSLPKWLMSSRNADNVLAFAPAPARHGGKGATLVLLRKK